MATRRNLLLALGAGALTAPLASFAQNQPKVWQIGFLVADSASTRLYDSFRQGMRDLGYVEGKTCVIRWRSADGKYERLPGLAEELVRLKVDVIVAGTTLSVQAAKKATTSVPIVMVAIPDPIGEGFAASLSRPGGNITGLSTIVTEASAKHVELLRVVIPNLSRVAVLINPSNPSDSLILEQINGAAFSSGVKVLPVEAGTAAEIEAGFSAMTRARAEAVIVAADSFFDVQRDQIARLAVKNRLPTIYSNREPTEAGGLMSYGQDLTDQYRRAAAYVDKILKGAKPSDLPVEQPLVLELVVNRKTAKALGLALPRELLLRADKLIE
ncbi:MAG: ABC transporter substrate-binding protein [Betaproteobacteria bacterium]|nr:ABC transporter substrate-binding protein [Betaproteobacteria bacterium]MBA3775459.1 ABC transporter substrate-binding protein [Betaproteobacteria bacterium]